MKKLLILITILFNLNILYANNPINSPTFDDILKNIIGNEKYIFDDKNITIKVPKFADNPLQVPIFVDASKIKDAKRLIIFADLNPIYEIIDMKTDFLLPIFSTNIKVAQETPLRALVLDKNDLWHIGSMNILSNGGGCDVSSQVAAGNNEFAKLLGKSKGKIFSKSNKQRIKTSIFHPMETGLIFGNEAFYINELIVNNSTKIISKIKTSAAISENPRFIFETKKKFNNLNIQFLDNDSNNYSLKL